MKESIGIIGGFGAYATLDFYRRLIESFDVKSERDLPHIIIDCNFTMPSRTRALLYGDDYEKIVDEISKSVDIMINQGVSHIVLVCGTAHAFLPDVYRKVPEARKRVVHIIECLNRELRKQNVDNVLLIAAEGTLKQRVYENELKNCHCISPKENEYSQIREFIESVKQHKMTEETIFNFKRFVQKFDASDIVLGCTEFPVLLEFCLGKFPDMFSEYRFWDPLEVTITEIMRILK